MYKIIVYIFNQFHRYSIRYGCGRHPFQSGLGYICSMKQMKLFLIISDWFHVPLTRSENWNSFSCDPKAILWRIYILCQFLVRIVGSGLSQWSNWMLNIVYRIYKVCPLRESRCPREPHIGPCLSVQYFIALRPKHTSLVSAVVSKVYRSPTLPILTVFSQKSIYPTNNRWSHPSDTLEFL